MYSPESNGESFPITWNSYMNLSGAGEEETEINADSTGDVFVGALLVHGAAAVNTLVAAGANISRMLFDDNVANTGGGAGTIVEITCISATQWFVTGMVEGNSDADTDGSAIFVNA